MYVPPHYACTPVCPVAVTMDTWMSHTWSHPSCCTQTPNTQVWVIESMSSRNELEVDFNEKTGQTALSRQRAWPDQHTDQQPADRWLYLLISPVLHIFSSQTTLILPFHTFDSSSKHPITSLAWSQNAFLGGCRAGTQDPDWGTGVSVPWYVWRQGSYHIS